MTQPIDLNAMRADMEAGTPGPWSVKHKETWPFGISLEPSILVMDRIAYSTAHKCLEGVRRAEGFENQDDVARMVAQQEANARLIASCPDMAAEILRLTAENERLRQNTLSKMPPDCAPKGAPVLVAGGIAMRKTGGEWFSGMCEPAFSRQLEWEPQWWAPIPQQNEPPCEALSQAPTYAEGYADALEAAAEMADKCRKQNGPLSQKGFAEKYRAGLESASQAIAAAIRALPIKEKPDD